MSTGIVVSPSAYRVSGLPDDHIDADTFAISIEWRGSDQWAVLRGSKCLSRTLMWDYEPQPSSRTKRWLREHRWTLNDATRAAVEVYPTVTINGMCVRGGEVVLTAGTPEAPQ